MALRHRDVKDIAKNWGEFTSDVPFRVPIPSEADVRSVRQLPIETDPPTHGGYRDCIREVFSRSRADEIRLAVAELVDALISGAMADPEPIDIVRQFALPLQSRALALMLGRSSDDAALWESWGTHVFRDSSADRNANENLDSYLDRVVDEALLAPSNDFFGQLATARFEGRPLRRDEILGFANLAFAGGRDTVIHLIVNIVHHVATAPDAFAALYLDDQLTTSAVEEYLRFFSPITHIGRVATKNMVLGDCPVAAGDTVSLCFASANRDADEFENSDRLIFDRRPNRHVAFGHGPHTCLGAPHTRMLAETLIQRITRNVAEIRLVRAEPKIERLGIVDRLVSWEPLVVEMVG